MGRILKTQWQLFVVQQIHPRSCRCACLEPLNLGFNVLSFEMTCNALNIFKPAPGLAEGNINPDVEPFHMKLLGPHLW